MTAQQSDRWQKIVERMEGLIEQPCAQSALHHMIHVYGDDDSKEVDRIVWKNVDERAERFGGHANRIEKDDPFDGIQVPMIITKNLDQ